MKKIIALLLAAAYSFAAMANASIVVDSISMRANDPTIMDVVYHGTSDTEKVDVRVIAFKDGVRSFANVLRVETFVDNTGTNVGDNVSIRGSHKLSWRVSSDWDIDLAKVSVEFLVKPEDGIIPMKFITIPAAGGKKAMKVSTTVPTKAQVFNALLWYYADKDPDFSVSDGLVYYVPCQKVIAYDYLFVSRSWHYSGDDSEFTMLDNYEPTDCCLEGYSYSSFMVTIDAMYRKLGYEYLWRESLAYAKTATRKSIYAFDEEDTVWYYCKHNSGYAYKWLDEE